MSCTHFLCLVLLWRAKLTAYSLCNQTSACYKGNCTICTLPLACNKMHPIPQRIKYIFVKIFITTVGFNVITKVVSHGKLQNHSWK